MSNTKTPVSYACRSLFEKGDQMAGKMTSKVRCSFCGKTENQVRKLISGPAGIYICDECIEICSEIIAEEDELLLD